MWLADNNIVTAEALEKETVLTYLLLLNNKLIETQKVLAAKRKNTMKGSGK